MLAPLLLALGGCDNSAAEALMTCEGGNWEACYKDGMSAASAARPKYSEARKSFSSACMNAHHPKACILPDVFHLYRGGSGLSGVARLNRRLLAGFHLNDYPANPPRDRIADKHRIYPGDGIAPLTQLIRDLRDIGYTGPLSIELFNPTYYEQDPALVARTALEKTKAVVRAAAERP